MCGGGRDKLRDKQDASAGERQARRVGDKTDAPAGPTHSVHVTMELYQQQLAVTQEYGGGAEEAKAHGNPGNAHFFKGGLSR